MSTEREIKSQKSKTQLKSKNSGLKGKTQKPTNCGKEKGDLKETRYKKQDANKHQITGKKKQTAGEREL
jgi:hypothetical protein